MIKPNLFIVGFPKSGSTALYLMLRTHPEISMSTPKEPEYFCFDLKEESDKFHGRPKYFAFRSEKDYIEIFERSKNKKILGEASTLYIYSRVAARKIYEFNPESKIIITIREPVSFLISFHKQLLFNEDEKITDFKKALEAEPLRREGKLIPKTTNFPSILFYTEWTKYWKHIKRYKRVFGDENIKIMIYEEFKKNNRETYNKVLDFIGVRRVNPPEVHANPTKENRFKLLSRLVKTLPYPVKRVGKYVFHRYLFWPYFKIIRKITHKKTEIENEYRVKLMKKFKKYVIKTEKITNLELANTWGYSSI